ncbi:MAG: hypothetical protein AB8H03_19225 [Saprospiraceae bacterium]
MNSKIRNVIFGLGWILLILFLISGYVFNKFSGDSRSAFAPIAWEDHVTVLQGALSCSLTDAELIDRKLELKTKIFSKLKKKVELDDGFVYYFDDEKELAAIITEFMLKEKDCCSFFKFDISILPFEKGIAFQISGSKGVKDLLVDFEKEV